VQSSAKHKPQATDLVFLSKRVMISGALGDRRVPQSPGEDQVLQASDSEHRVVDTVALEAAVAQDFPGLHASEGMLDAGADLAVGCVGFLFPVGEFGLPPLAAVRDDQAGAPVTAVRDHALLGDKGYDSNPNRGELRKRRILPVISRKGSPSIKGLGKPRYVVEQTFSLLHQFKRLAIRWERRLDLHDAFVSLACGLICWRRLPRRPR
jgi:hypothetical protein